MNLITLILITTIVIAIFFMAIALFYSIKLNFKFGEQQKNDRFSRYHKLPLAKFIKMLDLDNQEYINKTPLHKLEQEMTRCEQCSAQKECANKLEQQTVEVNEILYHCPNNLSILKNNNQQNAVKNDFLH